MRIALIMTMVGVAAILSGCGGRQEPSGEVEVVKGSSTPRGTEAGAESTPPPAVPAAMGEEEPPSDRLKRETPSPTPAAETTPAATATGNEAATGSVTASSTSPAATPPAAPSTPVPALAVQDAVQPIQAVTQALPPADENRALRPEELAKVREAVAAMPQSAAGSLPEGDSRRAVMTEASEQMLEKLDELGPNASEADQKAALEQIRAKLKEAEAVLREKSQ